MITSVQLNGANCNEWASEMFNALQGKGKMDFINGALMKPASNIPDLEG